MHSSHLGLAVPEQALIAGRTHHFQNDIGTSLYQHSILVTDKKGRIKGVREVTMQTHKACQARSETVLTPLSCRGRSST